MGELARKLIRWIIFFIIIIIIIALISKLTNRKKKVKETVEDGIQAVEKATINTINKVQEETISTPENTTPQVIDAVDTAASSKTMWLGIIIIGAGSYFIYRKREENS